MQQNSPVIVHGGFIPEGVSPEMLGEFGLDGQIQANIWEETEEDKNMLVVFFDGVRFMGYETSQRGYPVFVPCECVTIYIKPGISEYFYQLEFKENKFGKVEPTQKTREVISKYRSRYEKYKASKQGEAGTPFNVLPKSDIGLTATLINLKIDSLEKLITVKDEHLAKIDGAIAYKKQAEAYLNLSTDSMIQAKDLEIADLKRQLTNKGNDGSINTGDGARGSGSQELKQTEKRSRK